MDHPVLELECVFMTVDYLLGILIIATVVGGISETIAKTSAERDSFRHRLDNVKNYLRIRHVDGRPDRDHARDRVWNNWSAHRPLGWNCEGDTNRETFGNI